MTCESCVQDVSGSLHKLEGITKVDANLKDQLISIEGTGSSFPSQPDMVALGRTVF
jgi:copper chaperone for superoxide dismutase